MASNDWIAAIANAQLNVTESEKELLVVGTELANLQRGLPGVEKLVRNAEQEYNRNPTRVNLAVLEQERLRYQQELQLVENSKQALANADARYQQSLQTLNFTRQQAAADGEAERNDPNIRNAVPPPATSRPNVQPASVQNTVTAPATRVATPATQVAPPTSSVQQTPGIQNQQPSAIDQEPPTGADGLGTTQFGTISSTPRPVLSSEVSSAQAASEAEPSGEFAFNPKPVQNTEVANLQAASGTDSTTFNNVPLPDTVGGRTTAGSIDAARTSGSTNNIDRRSQGVDWRVKLSLAPNANYLYNVAQENDLLYPLKATGGVIFPYTPQITSSYRANYEPSEIVHTNYKQYFYRNSAVDEIQITATFTAQSTTEANYMLAVIHFFRTVTKMFYGQDTASIGPPAGTPPPLCYLFGFGPNQYKDHPLLISQFSYTLPDNVDYIRAGTPSLYEGQTNAFYKSKETVNANNGTFSGAIKSILRVRNSGLNPGGISDEPNFTTRLANPDNTYLPTKLSVSITCIPIVTRYDTTRIFSVADYATGKLYRGGFW